MITNDKDTIQVLVTNDTRAQIRTVYQGRGYTFLNSFYKDGREFYLFKKAVEAQNPEDVDWLDEDDFEVQALYDMAFF